MVCFSICPYGLGTFSLFDSGHLVSDIFTNKPNPNVSGWFQTICTIWSVLKISSVGSRLRIFSTLMGCKYVLAAHFCYCDCQSLMFTSQGALCMIPTKCCECISVSGKLFLDWRQQNAKKWLGRRLGASRERWAPFPPHSGLRHTHLSWVRVLNNFPPLGIDFLEANCKNLTEPKTKSGERVNYTFTPKRQKTKQRCP